MLEDDGRYRGVVVQGVGDMIWCRGRDWGGGGDEGCRDGSV